MEIVLYFAVVTIISVGVFWIQGLVYGLLRPNSIYFPLSLAAKMAALAVVGALLFMIDGVILATLMLNAEMKKRSDYVAWSTITVGIIMSLVGSAVIYVSAFALAWQILD